MQVGLIAEFSVPTKDFDRFLAAARRELQAVRQNEPGCLRFDVVIFEDVEGGGAFVEVFADQDAAERHRQLPHFEAFFDEIDDIEVEWTIRQGQAIE